MFVDYSDLFSSRMQLFKGIKEERKNQRMCIVKGRRNLEKPKSIFTATTEYRSFKIDFYLLD